MADNRPDVSYSQRIAKIKIRTCRCGDKLRGKSEICDKCLMEALEKADEVFDN